MNDLVIKYYDWYINNVSGDTKSPQIVGWTDNIAQDIRFKILLNIGVQSNDKILDYGCGVGHLIDYLEKIKLSVDYTGMDINPYFIQTAENLYKNNKFILGDFTMIKENYDWIIASGVFTVAYSLEEIFNSIDNLFQKANKGIAVNFLKYYDERQLNSEFNLFNPNDMLLYFESIYGNNVKLITDYTYDDFSIYILKN